MGALMRDFAWSETDLGPVETWPASLRSALATVLNSPRPIAIYWGPDYLCLYNDAYRGLLGDRHPGALGRPAREIFPEARPIIERGFGRVMKTGRAASEEQRLLPLEGGRSSLEAWFTHTAEPIFDEAGRVAGILNPAAEIIELIHERRERAAAEARGEELEREVASQRRAAAAHRESDDHFRRVADAAPALLWVTAPSGACTYLSRSWYEFTGRPTGTGLGFDWLETVHPEDREATQDAFVEAHARREPFQLNHRVRRHDGEYRWVLDSGRPRYDGHEEFLGYVGSVIDINDWQRAEEALHESEARYASLFDLIDQGFCIFEVAFDDRGHATDYRFVEVNPAFATQTGIRDAVGRWMREIAPDHEEHWFAIYGEVARTGESVHFQAESAALDGRWFDVNAFRVGEPGEHLVGALFNNIAPRIRQEAALQASAERAVFRARLADVLRTPGPSNAVQTAAMLLLGDHLGTDWAAWGNVDGEVQQIVVEIEHVSERAPRSLAGTYELSHFGAVLNEGLRDGRALAFADIDDTPELEPETVIALRGLQVRALMIVPVLRRSVLVGSLVVAHAEPRRWTPEEIALVEETAERTWTAIERAEAEQALRTSEERFRRLAESMPLVVWTADVRGQVEYYNSRGESYDGITRVREGEWEWQPVIHADDVEGTIAAWHEAVATGEPYEIEHRVRLNDGTYRWHLSRAQLVEAGGVIQWYGTSTDIHELMVANEVKDRFLAIASHELRNPVGVIHGTAQQIRRSQGLGTLTPERFQRYVDSLLETSTHLATLTNDLTDVSRLQRGALPLNVEPMDIAALVREVAQADEWAPRVHLEGAERPMVIEADPHRVRQVVTNLLDNALKYSPHESPVMVQVLPDGGGVRIDVTDHGIGLSQEDLRAIFTPFGRASNAGTVPGLGMGLFIAREVVERHGGELHAKSAGSGMGTTMSFWLPIESPELHLDRT